MKSICQLLILAVLAVSTHAQARVFASVTVADVETVDLELKPWTQYEWVARTTSGNAAPVLHIVQGGKDLARAFSPDQSVATLKFFSVFGGTATLVVRSASGSGFIELTESQNLGRPITLVSSEFIAFGSINVSSLNGPGEFFETAHAPGGIGDPALIGLDAAGAQGRIVAFDENSGVGNNAVISHIAIRELVMFHEHPDEICVFPEPCPVAPTIGSFYVNDRHTDTDDDGLGNELELALGTCPGHSVSSCTVSPDSIDLVTNTQDSDGDGLSDYAELFGVDHHLAPQYLSRWGADPRRKDVFVEIDRRKPEDAPPVDPADTFSDDDYRYIVNAFELGSSANDLENPDGSAGIRIHMDVGIDPTAEQLQNIPGALTLFGDWGGSSDLHHDIGTVDAGKHHMADVRQRLFRHGLLVDGEASTGIAEGRYFFWNGAARYFVHELGHTLGIEHHGAPALTAVNCKPHYISIMNYRYDYLDGSSTYDPSVFSDGSRTLKMNPAYVYEPLGIGVLDKRFYTAGQTELGVDWDFSGDISSRNIRAPLTFLSSNVCGTSWKNPQSLVQVAKLPAATPALARSADDLFAFWIRSDGRVNYRHSIVGGPDAKGSCPLSDVFETECASWSNPVQLPGIANATSVDAVALDGNVHLLTRSTDGFLKITSFRVNNGQLDSPSVLNVDDYAIGEPEIAGIYYRPPNAKGGLAIGVWYRGESSQLRQLILRDSGGLTVALGPQQTEIVGGPGIVPSHAPSVEAWPDIANPVAHLGRNCMALPAPDSVEMYCDTLGDNKYVHKQSLPLRGTQSKPSLEFRVHRLEDGRSLDGMARKGNFWLAYIRKERTRVAVSQPFDGTNEPTFATPDGNPVKWDFNFGGRQKVLPGTGVMLYMDDDTSALKAIAAQGPGALTTVNGVGQSNVEKGQSSVTFLPFADGTYRVVMRDSNDWATFADQMCRRLNNDGLCEPN